MTTRVKESALARLRQFDAGAIANAIETFDVRLRNEGFTDGSVRATFPNLPPVVGYAATARIRCSAPPLTGQPYHDRTDWWNYLLTIPSPRIVIVEDVDERPGLGAFIGHVHANILQALGCIGLATNGSVRDLAAVEQIGFQLFAGSVGVSHAFVHLVDVGVPVTIGGLRVAPGDVVYGDRHGLLTIPLPIIDQLADTTERLLAAQQRIVDFCHAPDFTLDILRKMVRQQE